MEVDEGVGAPGRGGGFSAEDDHLREECGVFAIAGHPDAANLAYLGLYALQHRGQESAGIATVDDAGRLHVEKGMGYVADLFTQESFARLPGRLAIGHVRYSTAGESHVRNAQPLVANTNKGAFAIGHNGNLVNGDDLRRELEEQGAIFNSSTDTEVFLHLVARSLRRDPTEAIYDALLRVRGAYSLVILSGGRVFAARDPHGFRPLCLGTLDGAPVVASETCAFDLIGATYVREVEPGELVTIDGNGLRSDRLPGGGERAHCVFEHVYFSRPDSLVFGKNVAESRKAFGRRLAIEAPAAADLVVPVPDSGLFAAQGYSDQSGIPFAFGLIRNHYVGRTFIEPKQSIRHFGVKVKLNPVRELIAGRRIVLIDDSIVRGTTSRKIVGMLRAAGAREVHMRISSPPTTHPCHYGIDTPHRKELIASDHGVGEIASFIEADSLGFLSREGMIEAWGIPESSTCAACFSGRYPVGRSEPEREKQTELFDPGWRDR
jgi:amidophosphoribosyltransferase